MSVKFPSEFGNRGTVKLTDKIMIANIDTGAVEYSTIAELLTGLLSSGITLTGGNKVGLNSTAATGQINFQIYSETHGDFIIEPSASGIASNIRFKVGDNLTGATVDAMYITQKKWLGVGTITPTSALQITEALPVYIDNANAAASGLTNGAFYRTADAVKVVHA